MLKIFEIVKMTDERLPSGSKSLKVYGREHIMIYCASVIYRLCYVFLTYGMGYGAFIFYIWINVYRNRTHSNKNLLFMSLYRP